MSKREMFTDYKETNSFVYMILCCYTGNGIPNNVEKDLLEI